MNPSATGPGASARRTSTFASELKQLEAMRETALRGLLGGDPQLDRLAYQADWHLRGLNYHLGRVYTLYRQASKEVGGRALAGADVIVTYAPYMQELTFEFYAFINLARITLDQLQRYALPAFPPGTNLPNSIREVLKAQSDFPVYVSLNTTALPVLRYLLDIRDCLTHDRTFATPDNTIAAREGFDVASLGDMPWFQPVTRVSFRRLGGKKISVNILLPDVLRIYSEDGTRGPMVRTFTYTQGINLLSQAREFARLCIASVINAMLDARSGKTYTFHRR